MFKNYRGLNVVRLRHAHSFSQHLSLHASFTPSLVRIDANYVPTCGTSTIKNMSSTPWTGVNATNSNRTTRARRLFEPLGRAGTAGLVFVDLAFFFHQPNVWTAYMTYLTTCRRRVTYVALKSDPDDSGERTGRHGHAFLSRSVGFATRDGRASTENNRLSRWKKKKLIIKIKSVEIGALKYETRSWTPVVSRDKDNTEYVIKIIRVIYTTRTVFISS